MSAHETIARAVEVECAVLEARRPLLEEIHALERRLVKALFQVASLQSALSDLENATPPHARISAPVLSPTMSKRARVLLKCGGKCLYCRRSLTQEEMTIDHFVPQAKGGRNNHANLVAACAQCNNRKDDRYPTEAELERYADVIGTPFLGDPFDSHQIGKRAGQKVWTKPNPPIRFQEVVRPFQR